MEFEEVRCPACGRFLFEASPERAGTFRIMCRSRQCKQTVAFVWRQPTRPDAGADPHVGAPTPAHV